MIAVCDQALPVNTNILVFTEGMVLGSLAYTSRDFSAVLELMSRDHYVTNGWVEHIRLTRWSKRGSLRCGRNGR